MHSSVSLILSDNLFDGPQPPVDFFGRPITIPRKASGSGAPRSKCPLKGFQTTYRYLEGNSAAVRKAVKIASFL